MLTSSITRYAKGGSGKQRVDDTKPENIRVPVLFVHHKEDSCYVTVAEDIPDLAKKFVNSPSVKIELVGRRRAITGVRNAARSPPTATAASNARWSTTSPRG